MNKPSNSLATDGMESTRAARAYYDKTQGSYDLLWMNKQNLAMHYGFWDDSTANLHEALVNQNRYIGDLLRIGNGDVVLDAGCGVGGTAIQFAETYGCKVTGVTISEKQVARARKHIARRNVQALVNVELADYCNTGLPDESFDKAYAIESMCYADDKGRFLREMVRVLKPGGTLVVNDVFLDGRRIETTEEAQLQAWLDGWAVPSMESMDGFRQQCVDAGFAISDDRSVQDEIMPSAKRIWRIGRLFYPFDKACNRLGLLSDETFGSTVACVAQYRLFEERIMNDRLLRLEKPL